MVGPDAAEDVAQQAFLKAWLGLEQFTGASSFGTWLYRLAMNCSLDHLRHTQRFQPEPLADAEAWLAADVDVAEGIVEALAQSARRRALARVSSAGRLCRPGRRQSATPRAQAGSTPPPAEAGAGGSRRAAGHRG